jgi:hypothetical protein
MILRDCLKACLVVELRAIARRHEVRLQSLLKSDIISQLERRLLEWTGGSKPLEQLSEPARAALVRLLASSAAPLIAPLEEQFGPLRRVKAGAIDSDQPWADGQTTPLDELHILGLLFRGEAEGDSGERALIPTDIQERLKPAGVARPRVFKSSAPPAVAAGVSTYACQDLTLLVSALCTAPAGRLASGGMSRRDLLKLNANLLAPDEITDVRPERCARRFAFLRMMGEALQLIVAGPQRYEIGPGVDDWLAMSSRGRMMRLLRTYPALSGFSELDDMPAISFSPSCSPAALSQARRFLIELLSEAEAGEWTSVFSLIQAARTRNSFLLRRPGDGSSVQCLQSGRALTARDWTIVEGGWIEAVITGPLHWLGLVEPGRTRRGELSCFRAPGVKLLAMAARALSVEAAEPTPPEPVAPVEGGGQETPPRGVMPGFAAAERQSEGAAECLFPPPGAARSTEMTGGQPVRVEDDLIVYVDAGTDLARWYRLERICELLERGAVSRYRVSREKVRQQFQAGVSPEQICADLGSDLPPAARETIHGWANRFGQVRVFSGVVIQAVDAPLMSELRARPEIGACLGPGLGSRASLITPGCEAGVVEAVRASGAMPHVELPSSGPPREVWLEISRALELWRTSAARGRQRGPSDCTLEYVTARLAESASLSAAELEQAGTSESINNPPSAEAGGILSLLEDAINRKHAICIDYDDPIRGPSNRIVVLPRSMGQQKGVTYLAGFRKGGASLDRFRLDWITNAALTDR